MSLGVFIYARVDSRRLPGKVLRPFGRATLLEHVIRRSLQVRAQRWSLLTSDRDIDEPLARVAGDLGLDIVRGSATDLVARTIKAIDTLEVTRFVRVNADSPLFEPRLVNALLERGRLEEFASNLLERRFPYGVAVESIDASLYQSLATTAGADELEHVTQHLYRQLERLSALSLTQQADHSHLNLAVDTQDDYERVQALFHPDTPPTTPYWELVNLEEPTLLWKDVPGLDS